MVNGNPVNEVQGPRDVADTPDKFGDRLANKTVTLDGKDYVVRAIPSLLTQYISGNSTRPDGTMNRGEMQVEYLRFGIISDTQVDRRILGTQYWSAPDQVLNAIPAHHLTTLFIEIMNLTHMSEDERTKLDFSTPSENEGSKTTDGETKP